MFVLACIIVSVAALGVIVFLNAGLYAAFSEEFKNPFVPMVCIWMALAILIATVVSVAYIHNHWGEHFHNAPAAERN